MPPASMPSSARLSRRALTGSQPPSAVRTLRSGRADDERAGAPCATRERVLRREGKEGRPEDYPRAAAAVGETPALSKRAGLYRTPGAPPCPCRLIGSGH